MFKRLFGSRASSTTSQSTRSRNDPGILLKQATAQQRAGDFDASVQTLRHAYKKVAKGETVYGIDTFLRLPLYLQKAGRKDEAWSEFNNLVVNGYPNQLDNVGVQLMERSKIYDKMRLFLQREGRNDEAIVFGVLSMLSWAKGLHVQKRRQELKPYIARGNIEATLGPLLKKAKRTEELPKFVDFLLGEVKNSGKIDPSGAAKRIRVLTAGGNAAP